MSFQQGLSGLNAASRNLDVIGNNVANANTVGAKIARAEFADVYANSLQGAGASPVGIGTQLVTVAQQFTQGDVATTNNPLDIAINGQGFFRTSSRGAIEYTRNGQFKLDRNGFMVNSEGSRLTGFAADANGQLLMTGAPTDIKLSTGDIAPRATAEGAITANLDARTATPTVPFNPSDTTSYSGATTMSVYDKMGREHPLSLYFRKTAGNEWDVLAAADGQALASNAPVGHLSFDTGGRLTAGGPLAITLPVGAEAGGTMSLKVDTNQVTQFGSAFGVTALEQDGFAPGRMSGFAINPEGVIQARYSNGQSRALGQIALANFTNPQGLAPLGGNAWGETASSGTPVVGAPGSGNLGALQSGAVENSNIDLTAELVNMMTAQRVYQANAQTVRTQDQVMQTLVNLR